MISPDCFGYESAKRQTAAQGKRAARRKKLDSANAASLSLPAAACNLLAEVHAFPPISR